MRAPGSSHTSRTALALVTTLGLVMFGCPRPVVPNGTDGTNTPGRATADIGPGGGILSVDDPASPISGVTLAIPEGAFDQGTVVTVEETDSPTPEVQGMGFVGPAVEIDTGGLQPAVPLSLTMSFDPATLPEGVLPEHLGIALFIPETNTYRLVPTSVTGLGQLTAELTHFSLYRIIHGRFPANRRITWCIGDYTTNAPGVSSQEVHDAVEAAFGMWARVLAPAGISFQETGPGAHVVVNWNNNMWNPINWVPRVGENISIYGVTDWNIFGNRLISLNDQLLYNRGRDQGRWVVRCDGDYNYAGQVDIQMVVAHEIGHALGKFGHIGNGTTPPLMAPGMGTYVMHTISSEDEACMREIYGIGEDDSGDSYEPDSDSAHATSIGSGETQTHSIVPVGDEDWLRFSLDQTSDVVIETSGPSGDTRLWLYDSGLSEIAFDDDRGTGLFSHIEESGLPSGTYYIKVDEFGNNSEIATYDISLTVTPTGAGGGGGGGESDSYEPDDDLAHATSISSGQTQTHSIVPVGDQDWLRFNLSRTANVLIETSGPSGDTCLWLYDSGLAEITYNDDGGAGLFSRIEESDLSSGTYYVKVDEFGNANQIATYDISLTVTGGSPPPPDQTGRITGTVVDAQTGQSLGGVLVRLSGTGQTTHAVGSGTFSFDDVPAGNYVLTFSLADYIDGSANVTVAANQETEVTVALVRQGGGADMVAVVLTWGTDPETQPSDLDLHVSGPDGAGGRFHVCYWSRSPVDHASLDQDDTDWGGPETITISPASSGSFVPGEYSVWVHNYSGSPELNGSAAVISLTAENQPWGQYSVGSASGDPSLDIWRVIDITVAADGSVTNVRSRQTYMEGDGQSEF